MILMDPKNAIEVRNITKSFKIEVEDPEGGLLHKKKTVENKVLDGITLDIRKGDVLGVLGRNGSGKSTFLSILAKIMEPDSGTIERNGKIAAILELGMGFHPDMSGRENIFLKGELYGFSRKEMEAKLDAIIEYSGIGKYIDNPVRTYSSGMSGRLAFSIMMNVESDIMLVDEVLSVGDAAFSAKAKEHFKKLSKSGKTVVFVSHSIGDVASMCNRAIWIENGIIIKDGKADVVCAEYQNKMSSSPEIVSDLAEAGVAESQYQLALMYRDGTNFGKSDELYHEWMKRAADQGHTLAQVEYAGLLMQDGGDLSEAMSLYQSAANKGNNDARMGLASFGSKDDGLRAEARRLHIEMGESDVPLYMFRCGDFLLKTAWTPADRSEAFGWFLKAADAGFPQAMHQVGVMYRDGNGTVKDTAKMEEYLLKASEAGFMPSITLLADIYSQGRLLPRNDPEAFRLYLLGAELGNGGCMYKVATMYQNGVGTEVDEEKADMWFSRFSYSSSAWNLVWASDWARSNGVAFGDLCGEAAELGLAPAYSSMVNLSVSKGESAGFYLEGLKELASRGNVDAMRRYANCLFDGVGVSKDLSGALVWYEKAADTGDSWSLNRCGEMYRDGRGTAVDLPKAICYFEKAADLGNVGSMANMVVLISLGRCEGDVGRYLKTMENLALGGNSDASFRLGSYYYDGVAVRKDYAMALKWYLNAARLGHQWCKVRCGEMFRDGKGTPVDIPKAAEMFSDAAMSGNVGAMANMVNLISTGMLEGDVKEYLGMMEAVASTGNSDASHRLGNYYYDGVAVKRDYSIALKWYLNAAQLGHQWCKVRVAEMYRDGKGTVADMNKAAEMFGS